MYWSGDWAAGSYEKDEVVKNAGALFVCLVATTEIPPGSADWELLAQGSNAGYGELSIGSDKVYGTINGTWQAVDLWDSVSIPNLNCTTNLDGTFTFAQTGWWSLYFYMSASHNDSQGGRVLSFRLYNVTDNIPADDTDTGVGRNVTVSTANMTPWFEITDITKTYRLEMAVTSGQDFLTYTATTATLRLKQEV